MTAHRNFWPWGVTHSHHSSFSTSNRTTKNSDTQNKLGIASSTIYSRFKVKIELYVYNYLLFYFFKRID